jgi:hypothetical protein
MTREDIEHMWKVASNDPNHDTNWHDPVVIRFAALVASAEREACAKTCEQITNDMSKWHSAYLGVTSETKFIRKTGEIIGQPFIEAIRARGQI